MDLRTSPAGRLDDKVKMRPGSMTAMNGGEDPFAPVRLARGGAAAARDQFERVGRAAQRDGTGTGDGDDGLTFRHD